MTTPHDRTRQMLAIERGERPLDGDAAFAYPSWTLEVGLELQEPFTVTSAQMAIHRCPRNCNSQRPCGSHRIDAQRLIEWRQHQEAHRAQQLARLEHAWLTDELSRVCPTLSWRIHHVAERTLRAEGMTSAWDVVATVTWRPSGSMSATVGGSRLVVDTSAAAALRAAANLPGATGANLPVFVGLARAQRIGRRPATRSEVTA